MIIKEQASFILSIPVTSARQHLHRSRRELPVSERSGGVSLPANTKSIFQSFQAAQISTDRAPFFLTSIRKERTNLWILAAAVLWGEGLGSGAAAAPAPRAKAASWLCAPAASRQPAGSTGLRGIQAIRIWATEAARKAPGERRRRRMRLRGCGPGSSPPARDGAHAGVGTGERQGGRREYFWQSPVSSCGARTG